MQRTSSLRKILLFNASFSMTGAISCLFFYQELSLLMHIDIPEILIYIGMGLLLFALYVGAIGRVASSSSPWVLSIIVQDIIWVLGSGIILLFQLFSLSTMGYSIVALIAICVALFAYFQYKHIR